MITCVLCAFVGAFSRDIAPKGDMYRYSLVGTDAFRLAGVLGAFFFRNLMFGLEDVGGIRELLIGVYAGDDSGCTQIRSEKTSNGQVIL